jgi:hypothetical protein
MVGRRGTQAAVLLALYGWPEDPGLIFTERRADLRRHAGEISFPGGRQDPGDADLAATALREAQEEIALDPAAVEPIGALAPVSTFVTGYRVHPFPTPASSTCSRTRPRSRPSSPSHWSCCARATRCAASSAAASPSTPRPTRSKATSSGEPPRESSAIFWGASSEAPQRNRVSSWKVPARSGCRAWGTPSPPGTVLSPRPL